MKHEITIQTDADGKLIAGKTLLVRAFKALSGRRLILTLEPYRKRRSNLQNRYFHGVVIPMVQTRLIELGWSEALDPVWVKDLIKYKFLLREMVNKETGKPCRQCRTSSLTTTEMMELIAQVQQWAVEDLDLYIPDPNEQTSILTLKQIDMKYRRYPTNYMNRQRNYWHGSYHNYFLYNNLVTMDVSINPDLLSDLRFWTFAADRQRKSYNLK